jgi:hypothetical protein
MLKSQSRVSQSHLCGSKSHCVWKLDSACRNHNLRVKITLVRVEITVVSVVITFVGVKITLCVYKSFLCVLKSQL